MRVVAPGLVQVAGWAALGAIAALILIYAYPRSIPKEKERKPSKRIEATVDQSTKEIVEKVVEKVDDKKEVTKLFKDKYTFGKRLGSGTYAVVREGFEISTGTKYAIKCIKKASLSKTDLDALLDEIQILQRLDHPNIMSLYEVYSEDDYYFLVTEFMAGGELFDRIVDKTFYSEKEARDLVQLLLEAIKYCHDRNVVHRDLKPENLLLTSVDDDASIKIADFGFAKQNTNAENGGLTTACGTPGYVAPEILKGQPYGKTVDIWSIGIITYILLCGYPPFHDENQRRLFQLIKTGQYTYNSPYWDDVSKEAKDFIGNMLRVVPSERYTVEQLLSHPWITGEVSTTPLTTAIVELKKYNHRRKFKAAVRTVQATAALTRGLTKNGMTELTVETNEPILEGLHEKYKLGDKLGEGAFSIVRSAVELSTGKIVAVKCIKAIKLDPTHFAALGDEINFLRKLQHPNIITLFDVYKDKDYHYLVTEFMAGGELFDRIVEQSFYSENDARKLVYHLLNALQYCHDHDIVHRDLKPENLFLSHPSDHTSLKLGDFGYAAHAVGCTLTAMCGTPSYVAPEVISYHPYGKPVDVWSVGVITYILLCGHTPFYADNQIELFSQIKGAKYTWPSDLSSSAKNFVAKMLVVDPTERYTVSQLLKHPWIADDQQTSAPLMRTLEELKKFNLRRKFKAGVRAVQAFDMFAKLADIPSNGQSSLHSPPRKKKHWFQSFRIFSGQ